MLQEQSNEGEMRAGTQHEKDLPAKFFTFTFHKMSNSFSSGYFDYVNIL